MDKKLKKIFKNASKTFYNASRFFPEEYKKDVYILYGFVRTADNYVDNPPQDKKGFLKFKKRTITAIDEDRDKTGDEIVDIFVEMARRKDFKRKWIVGFLESMESDLKKQKCKTMEDSLEYIYGSAEVIGLMMTAILDLPAKSHKSAQYLGRAFQYINFIRDVAEDNKLNRQYLPQEELDKVGLRSLKEKHVSKNPKKFKKLIRNQVKYYRKWYKKGVDGYKFIPRKLRIPIKTAGDMYLWTASVIEKDPLIVFEKKVKPSKLQVILNYIKNFFMSIISFRKYNV
jgi:phytoene synthase